MATRNSYPPMQRRHFEFIADVIKECAPEIGAISQEVLALAFAAKLRHTNPNFRHSDFMTASMGTGYKNKSI